ncbi:MAG: hypothetical protein KKB79_01400 [Nanoarchaeota archaeon]|nr:hypothetical protein [Nanoarchaeota archaeon]
MENKSVRIERGQINLIVPTLNAELRYVHPALGPDSYNSVGKQILDRGQKVPTGNLTVPLIHMAYCNESVKDEKEFSDIRNIMEDRWLWVFNRNIWTSQGVYVVQDEEALGRNAPFDIEELEDKLSGGDNELRVRFSQDRKTRFAPKSTYSLGKHTPESLARDGFVIANYDINGAEKLGEVSSEFKYNPKTFGLNIEDGQVPQQRTACLDSGWDFDDGGLGVCGDDWDDYEGGCAFGIEKSEEDTQ